METEAKTKKNNDYSASAVNLNNNITVKELLDSLHTYQRNEAEIQQQVKASIPKELLDQVTAIQDRIKTITDDLKKAVDELGSFQDVEKGEYAVKMRVCHVDYDAEAFEKHYPGYAPAVIDIQKTINKVSLKGLIKAEKITEDALKQANITTEKNTYRYIIE
jgi:predicted transcriptional regulator